MEQHKVASPVEQPMTTEPVVHEHAYSNERRDIESGEVKPEYSSETDEKYAVKDQLSPEITDGSSDNETRPLTREEKRKAFMRRYKPFILFAIWGLMTGWWVAGLVFHRNSPSPKSGWLVPTLLWIFLTIRFVTFHVKASYALVPVKWVWNNTVVRIIHMIPERFRLWVGAAGTIAVIITATFASETSPGNDRKHRAISLVGLGLMILAFYFTSHDRRRINWHTVIVGMLMQFILALFVLRTQAGYDIFNFIATLATDLLGMARIGTVFLTNATPDDLNRFILGVIPPIIFFVAFVQLLYFWGVLQWAVVKFAHIFFWGMRVSGAEAVVAAASPFVGQGESAMLIRPFIPHLTNAEIHQIMCSGFATIAGSVLAAYISMGISPTALVSSCVMSIPASLAISKLRYPELEEPLTAGKVVVPEVDEERPQNGLHAFANGAWLGIKIAGMIVSSLLCILALLGLVNGLLTWWGRYLNINNPTLTIDLILGYIFYPVAFFLGVDTGNGDILKVARLIGTKVVANEFVAFAALTGPDYASISDRSRLIATYAVCGFGNISSVGIQMGILSQLAPKQSGRIAKVALSALISGVVSTLTSASIAGMLVTDASRYTAVGGGGT